MYYTELLLYLDRINQSCASNTGQSTDSAPDGQSPVLSVMAAGPEGSDALATGIETLVDGELAPVTAGVIPIVIPIPIDPCPPRVLKWDLLIAPHRR